MITPPNGSISICPKIQNKNVGKTTFLFCIFPTFLFYHLQERNKYTVIYGGYECLIREIMN